jgi:hypothetical protein
MKTSSELVKEIYLRLDKYSLVVQKDGDEGDSAYRSAIFAFLLNAINHPQAKEYYEVMIHNLSAEKGIFRRTANPDHWGHNPNNLSRDQAAAIILAATVNGDNETVDAFYKHAYHRSELVEIPKYGMTLRFINPILGFHQNIAPGTDAPESFRKVPDLLGIGEARNEIRRKRQWWKYPMLMIYDLDLVLAVKFRKKQLWDFDSLYCKDLIYANQHMPTPFSYLAKKLYAKTDYIVRLRVNYSDVNNGIEPLGELYELVCRKEINNETL